ncbi:MAG: hypothetical protein [Microviridae sp.]|nr:MAG: hypothetical protein [Microviridae sp.]
MIELSSLRMRSVYHSLNSPTWLTWTSITLSANTRCRAISPHLNTLPCMPTLRHSKRISHPAIASPKKLSTRPSLPGLASLLHVKKLGTRLPVLHPKLKINPKNNRGPGSFPGAGGTGAAIAPALRSL